MHSNPDNGDCCKGQSMNGTPSEKKNPDKSPASPDSSEEVQEDVEIKPQIKQKRCNQGPNTAAAPSSQPGCSKAGHQSQLRWRAEGHRHVPLKSWPQSNAPRNGDRKLIHHLKVRFQHSILAGVAVCLAMFPSKASEKLGDCSNVVHPIAMNLSFGNDLYHPFMIHRIIGIWVNHNDLLT